MPTGRNLWFVVIAVTAAIAAGIVGLNSSGTNPPTAPLGLIANDENGSVDLNWLPATDNGSVAGYEIFRNNALIASPTASTSFTGTTSSGSATITAVSSFTGIQVNSVIAATDIPLHAQVASINVGADTITLGALATASTTTESMTSANQGYTDSTAVNGVTYSYSMKAVDNQGNVSVTTPRIPATPHNLGTEPFTQGPYGPPDRTTERGIHCNGSSPAVNVFLPAQTANANGCYTYWPPTSNVTTHPPVILVFQGTSSAIAACSSLTVDACVQSNDDTATANWYITFNAAGSTYSDSFRAAGYAVVIMDPPLWTFGTPPTSTCCAAGWRNDAYDNSFIAAVLDDVVSRESVDRNREYAFGFSGGGHAALAVACEMSSRIAAVVDEAHSLFGPSRIPSAVSNFYACPRPEIDVPLYQSVGTTDAVNGSPGCIPCDTYTLGSDPSVQLSGSLLDYSPIHTAASWAWRMGCSSTYTTTNQPAGFPSASDVAYSWTSGCGLNPHTGKTADERIVVFQGAHTQNYTGLTADVLAWIQAH